LTKNPDPLGEWVQEPRDRGRVRLSADVGNHTRDANTALSRKFRKRPLGADQRASRSPYVITGGAGCISSVLANVT
jgi:hypothetical protein